MAIFASPGGGLASTSNHGGRVSDPATPATDFYSSGWGGDYDQLTASYSYTEIYRCLEWAAIPVNKLTGLLTQLPLRVLKKVVKDDSRVDARKSPYGQLLMRPSPMMSPEMFWQHFAATYYINGESPLFKLRDEFGVTRGFHPIHPTRLRYGPNNGQGHEFSSEFLTSDERLTGNRWWLSAANGEEVMLLRRDLAIWRAFNPHSLHRGMSRYEPLRSTFESEAATSRAASAVWRNGGKPSFVLSHPGRFGKGDSVPTSRALADQFQRRHGGVTNWGKPLVLQEGMQALPLPIDSGVDYSKIREANQITVAAMFNIPQHAVGILTNATFSNITEQRRAIYQDTMPPALTSLESLLDFEVRQGNFDLDLPPEFSDPYYAEWDLSGVLRGSAEDRIKANAQAIQTGQLMPSEARAMDNRPFVVGSDRLFVNGAVVPIEVAGEQVTGGMAIGSDGADLPAATTEASGSKRSVMGQLGRVVDVGAVDVPKLVSGLDEASAEAVAYLVAATAESGGTPEQLREAVNDLEFV